MKTLQEQYNLIKEGKGNKTYFLKSAFRLFPDVLSPVNTFEDTVTILKNRSIISEGIGGLVTSGKKQDWHSIFKENIDKIKEDDIQNKENIKKAVEYYNQNAGRISMKDAASKFNVAEFDVISALNQGAISGIRFENINEAKEKEEPSKEVLDNQKHNFDYKDEKNYDNLFGEEFLKGYYTELKDPSNADKDVDELRAIVAKNLAKDHQYYVKNGQFGVKGLGYTTEAPGLGEPKEPKGKFKSSGYGDLKESVLRSQIYLLVKEVLSEAKAKFNVGDIVTYKGEEYKITRFIDDRIYIKSIIHGGRGESWVTASDLQKAALTEEKSKSDLKVILNNLKKALAIAEKEIKIVDKNGKAFKEFEKTIAGKKREIEAVEREIKALEKKSLTEDNGYEMGEGDIVKYKKEYAKSDTHFMITKDLGDTVVMRKVDAQGEPVGPFIPQVGKVQLEPVDIEFKQGLETGDLDS